MNQVVMEGGVRVTCHHIKNDDFRLPQHYMYNRCVSDSQLAFRLRTQMLDLPGSMKGKYKGKSLNCQSCDAGVVLDQFHLAECSAYTKLRHGLDLNDMGDLIKYFRRVMLERVKSP